MVILDTVKQSNEFLGSDAMWGLVSGVIGVVGTLLGVIIGVILQKIGKLHITFRDFHGKYYNNDQYGNFDYVVYNGSADGFGFQCDLHAYNSKNSGTGISSCYLEIAHKSKRIRCEIPYGDLYNISANELKIQTILAKFEPGESKIAVDSVKKIYMYFYYNGGKIRHCRKYKIPYIYHKEEKTDGKSNEQRKP